MLAKIYRNTIPENLRTQIYNLFLKQVLSFCRAPLFSLQKIFLKASINSYYIKHHQELDWEYTQAIQFINRHGLKTFLSDFIFKYENDAIGHTNTDVHFSNETNMYYIIHEGKKLFFPNFFTKSQIKSYYLTLLLEQDPESPHCYLSNNHHI